MYYNTLLCIAMGRVGWTGSFVATRPGQATTRPAARPRHGVAGAGRAAQALGARPGRAAGLQAVHSVHSACF